MPKNLMKEAKKIALLYRNCPYVSLPPEERMLRGYVAEQRSVIYGRSKVIREREQTTHHTHSNHVRREKRSKWKGQTHKRND